MGTIFMSFEEFLMEFVQHGLDVFGYWNIQHLGFVGKMYCDPSEQQPCPILGDNIYVS